MCVDETIFPYYGKNAFEAGLLQKIAGKPYDYGLVTYLLAQPLLFTGLPICLSVAATWTGPPPTPVEAALLLLGRLPEEKIAHFGPHVLVADSLWSHPAHLERFALCGVKYTVAVKESNTFLPAGLFALAVEDLPAHHVRTYTNGSVIFQVYSGDDSTTGVLSNRWKYDPSPPPRIGKYKTAQYLFRHEDVPTLVAYFRLPEQSLKKSKATVIFEGTGWDVLRPPDRQTHSEPLTKKEEASKMSKEALLTIHHQTAFKLRRPAKDKTVQELLLDLFPESEQASEEPPRKRRQSSRWPSSRPFERRFVDLQRWSTRSMPRMVTTGTLLIESTRISTIFVDYLEATVR